MSDNCSLACSSNRERPYRGYFRYRFGPRVRSFFFMIARRCCCQSEVLFGVNREFGSLSREKNSQDDILPYLYHIYCLRFSITNNNDKNFPILRKPCELVKILTCFQIIILDVQLDTFKLWYHTDHSTFPDV